MCTGGWLGFLDPTSYLMDGGYIMLSAILIAAAVPAVMVAATTAYLVDCFVILTLFLSWGSAFCSSTLCMN